MSRHGEITLAWGDGEHLFRLGYGELRQLQEACDAGPAFVAQRLIGNSWRVEDVRETLRLGLIGGGMTQGEALDKVRRFVEAAPYRENCIYAYAVINAALAGVTDEKIVGKAVGARKTKATGSRVKKSPSQPSTAAAP